MNEIDAVVQILNKKCSKILVSKKLTNKEKLGNIGEIFVRYAVKQCFWNRNYKISYWGNNTFTIYRQYRAYDDELRGMDHYLRFRNNWWKTFRCFIEVKNWKPYKSISDPWYNDNILSRFIRYDKFHFRCWILAINKRNIPLIEDRCRAHNINIVPIDQHITPQYLHPILLKPIFQYFMKDFNNLIDRTIDKRIKYGFIHNLRNRV